nr:MAG TPA: hypothetical protein [Caudoviricetes sp.]
MKEEYPRYTIIGVPRMTYDLFYFFLYHFKEYTHDPVW